MTRSTSTSSSSILQDERIKPGIYKIKNLVGGTFVDIKDHVRELCGRPSSALESSRGQWEILHLGQGYTIRKAGRVVAGKPEQYCIMLEGTKNGSVVSVSSFPVAWKIAVVNDEQYSGSEYVRISWGSTNMVWDLEKYGSSIDGTRVQVMDNNRFSACRVWELIPVESDDFSRQSSSSTVGPNTWPSAVPLFEERAADQCCACSHTTTEPADDGYGTTVIEVTTVTTRKKYRVED